MWRWGKDTFDTGYRVLTLFHSRRLGVDCYLFRYVEGAYIPKHKDPATGGKMYRFNIELIKAITGGEFKCPKMIWSWRDRLYFFRADNSYHKVTTIDKGSRWVLSFGKTVG